MKQINRCIPILWLVSIVTLALFYTQLPAQVGTHLNFNGDVDGWGAKSQLWIIPVIFLVIWFSIFVATLYASMGNALFKGQPLKKKSVTTSRCIAHFSYRTVDSVGALHGVSDWYDKW